MFRQLLSRSCSLNARHCSTASAVKMEMKNPDKLFKCIDIELRYVLLKYYILLRALYLHVSKVITVIRIEVGGGGNFK